MKFTSFQTGHAGLILTCCIVISSCNKQEFFKAEEFLVGKDAYCFQEGPDLDSCHALGDECRAAYLDAEDGSQEPVFAMCIANPNYSPTDGSTTGGTDAGGVDAGGVDAGGVDAGGVDAGGVDAGGVDAGGVDAGGVDAGGVDAGGVDAGGVDAGGADAGGVDAGGADAGGTVGGGSSAGGSSAGGSSAGGSNAGGSNAGGSNAGGSNAGGSGSVDPTVPPTIEEAFRSKCNNLDEKYLWVKKEVTKDGKKKTTSKVKVCHQTGNGLAHTIVIACPALKAHIAHEDYLGVCEE